jgi:hypothetical protein
MPLTKFQVNMAADTVLPKDRLVNTLHYECSQVEADLLSIAQAIVDAYLANWTTAATREWLVRAYDVAPPPQFPLAELLLNEGSAPASNGPREIALCLSYYAGRNIPRQRGRIYLPKCLRTGSPAVRPSLAEQTAAVALGTALSSITAGGATWAQYSPTTGEWRPVTAVWCDDEWDTVRSRGLDATDRVQAAV